MTRSYWVELADGAAVARFVAEWEPVEVDGLHARVEIEEQDAPALEHVRGVVSYGAEAPARPLTPSGALLGPLPDERAAVVAWLRQRANAPHPVEAGEHALSPGGRGLLRLVASQIQAGEHVRGGVSGPADDAEAPARPEPLTPSGALLVALLRVGGASYGQIADYGPRLTGAPAIGYALVAQAETLLGLPSGALESPALRAEVSAVIRTVARLPVDPDSRPPRPA